MCTETDGTTGIGGMAAAVGCGLAGHEVLVLEDAPAIGEVGAGIQVAPNMMRILERWGLNDAVIKDSVSLTSIRIRRWQTGALLGMFPINRTFGDQYVIHRADLHRALYDRAVSLPNVKVLVNSTVIRANFATNNTSVELANGRIITADVILAADGIKSRLRRQVLDLTVDEPVPTGDAAYRVVLPREAMLHDPELRKLIEEPRGTRWVGPGRHIMAYPIKQHKFYNMVLLHPDGGDSEESWTAKGTKQELIDTYKGWDPVLHKLFKLIPDETVLKWKLCTHDFLDTWVRGNVALLGDACHPMLPYIAQGAAQAVEDAAILALLLSEVTSAKDIPQVLKQYEIARKSRAEAIQGTSLRNRDILHLPDGAEQRARDKKFAQIFSGGENPDKWGDLKEQRFLWGWDAEKAAREVMTPPQIRYRL
ncbi:FAD/NAD(P)-binding domain-containing protein [Wilcoxina mikolae CBS 423.85]|nr:FAD/NAD(P)-binding domain-containing protein [Wilcoxina mikolae CBS 423.85]